MKKIKTAIINTIVNLRPGFLAIMPFVICFVTLGLMNDTEDITKVWRNIFGIIGSLFMIVSTTAVIVYRHQQGDVYNMRNASKERIRGFSTFVILFTLYVTWMLFSKDIRNIEALIVGAFGYLSGYLTFKYIIIRKYERDFGMMTIWGALLATAAILVKAIQAWVDLGIKIYY